MRAMDSAMGDDLLLQENSNEGDLTYQGLADRREMIEGVIERKEEPDWMRKLRRDHLDLFFQLPLPDTGKLKIEKWDFSRFSFLQSEERQIGADQGPEELSGLVAKDQRQFIVQENGNLLHEEIPASLQRKGVLLMDIRKALREHPDLVRRYFLKGGKREAKDRLAALHAALWNGGVFLYVPANVVIDEPLLVYHSLTEDMALMNPHTILVLEENSQVRFVEVKSSLQKTQGSLLSMTEIFVGKGAKLSFAGVYRLGAGTVAYDYKSAEVDADGQVDWSLGEMGDGNSVAENETRLIGQGAAATSKLIGIGTGEQKGYFTSRVFHHGKRTDSDILAKGVLLDRAVQVYSGITKIEKGATKANGEQTERIMMLSGEARGDANPILLIDEDDVKCGHAASVGRIDDTQVYYLMSRGIPRKEAERLLIFAFLQPVLEGIPLPAVRELLLKAIEGKLTR